jgi:kynurenine formamidase
LSTSQASPKTHSFAFAEMIDLSVSTLFPTHRTSPGSQRSTTLRTSAKGSTGKGTFGATEEDLVLSQGKGAAFEEVTAITHAGTHVDAPWHYGPQSEGKPAKKIEVVAQSWEMREIVAV